VVVLLNAAVAKLMLSPDFAEALANFRKEKPDQAAQVRTPSPIPTASHRSASRSSSDLTVLILPL
jgi:hypothetical protein